MSEVERRRPLSPHLQVYRPMLTMMMSIVHRITGAALYVGALLLVYYLVAAASGPGSFATAAWLYGSVLGQIILFGFTWALLHHLLGGIRHAIWDTGYGMDHPAREYLAQGTAIGGIALTVIVWALVYLLH
jgi:succinate dehydrogenase / fumarate reductase cytochrome b subunit